MIMTKTAKRLKELKSIRIKVPNAYIGIQEIIDFKNELKDIYDKPLNKDIIEGIRILIEEIESIENLSTLQKSKGT